MSQVVDLKRIIRVRWVTFAFDGFGTLGFLYRKVSDYRCNIIHLALMLRCQCLSVRLSVCDGSAWRIIANLGFKFRSQFTAHCGRSACGCEGRDHRREEWRDHLTLCLPLLGPLVLITARHMQLFCSWTPLFYVVICWYIVQKLITVCTPVAVEFDLFGMQSINDQHSYWGLCPVYNISGEKPG